MNKTTKNIIQMVLVASLIFGTVDGSTVAIHKEQNISRDRITAQNKEGKKLVAWSTQKCKELKGKREKKPEQELLTGNGSEYEEVAEFDTCKTQKEEYEIVTSAWPIGKDKDGQREWATNMNILRGK